MLTTFSILGSIGVVIISIYIVTLLKEYLVGSKFTTKIPGPPAKSFIFGHTRELLKGEVGDYQFQWKKKYGNVVKYKGILGENCLLISDARAIQHISNRPDQYGKHDILKEFSRIVFGKGLIWADGDDHIRSMHFLVESPIDGWLNMQIISRQRRINSPAFGSSQVRSHILTFEQCAKDVVEKWNNAIEQGSSSNAVVIDVSRMISLCSLDAIGKAAFDYSFNAIADGDNDSSNELAACFRNYAHDVIGALDDVGIFVQEAMGRWLQVGLARLFYDYAPVPVLRRIRYVTALGHQAANTMVEMKRAEMEEGMGKKDILSLLVRANCAPSDSKLRLKELSATLHTIIIAGHETTATWMNWIMYELARNQAVQMKLREEIDERYTAAADRGELRLSSDDYEHKMPYLQAVLKETLRYHPAVYHHLKVSTADSVVPLRAPLTATDGTLLESIAIEKGTRLYIDFSSFNRDAEIFGDAELWRPERFLNKEINEAAGITGLYGSVMTFSAGPRTCIGWRLAVMEASIFTTTFVRNFEFRLSSAATRVKREAGMALIPVIKGEEEKGHQLPLVVSQIENRK